MNYIEATQVPCVAFCVEASPLPFPVCLCYGTAMIRIINIGDRTRLRERFYGATRTVLARL